MIPSAYADGTDCAGWAVLIPHPRPFSQWEKGENIRGYSSMFLPLKGRATLLTTLRVAPKERLSHFWGRPNRIAGISDE